MPNQGNKSNGNSSGVKSKRQSTMPDSQKSGTAGSTKHSRKDNGKSAAGSSGKGGSKNMAGERGDH